MGAQAAWTSLEVAKLIVSALTPVIVATVAFWLNRRLKSLEQAQWSQQKVVERRIKAYDELAKPLNQLYCYFCYVGSWKELDPSDIVKLKRELDQTAHVSAPLFDQAFLRHYNALLDACFETFGGWGEDAKLRTLSDPRKQAAGTAWRDEWETCFTTRDEATVPSAVKAAYADLMAYLGRAMGAVDVDEHLLGSAHIPSNFERTSVGVVSRTAPDEKGGRGPDA